jgi:biopolymer transport protein ExbD
MTSPVRPAAPFRDAHRRFLPRCRRDANPVDTPSLLAVGLTVAMFLAFRQPYVLPPAVRLSLPRAPFTDAAAYDARVLLADATGTYYFAERRFRSLPDLADALAGAAATAAASRETLPPLLIEADRSLPLSVLAAIHAAAREAGWTDVSFAVAP